MTDSGRLSTRRFRFRISVQVRFRDVDAMGHVNHAVYFSYLEMARCEYWMSLFGLKRSTEIDFIVVHAQCSYPHPARYAEWLEVGVAVTEIRISSFVMEYEVRTRRSRRKVATGTTTQVLFDYGRNRTKAFSAALRRRIENFETGRASPRTKKEKSR